MSTFSFWLGVADAAVGTIVLTKPEIIYHSALAKLLNRASGLRLPNPYATAGGEVSAQHAVAIITIAVGLGHVRASKSRQALPALVVMNTVFSTLALGTVIFKPHRATSVLLMTGINHFIFASIQFWRSNMTWREVLGLEDVKTKEL